MKLKLIMLVSLFAIAFAGTAIAGNVADGDSDGVPDTFDNCINAPNGPAGGGCSAQQNADGDAFGDACDSDYTGTADGFVDINDFGTFFSAFTVGSPLIGEEDHNCDTFVDINDFGIFFDQFVSGFPGFNS